MLEDLSEFDGSSTTADHEYSAEDTTTTAHISTDGSSFVEEILIDDAELDIEQSEEADKEDIQSSGSGSGNGELSYNGYEDNYVTIRSGNSYLLR